MMSTGWTILKGLGSQSVQEHPGMIGSMDAEKLKCDKCGEPLNLTGVVDGREIDVDKQRRAGPVQSAEFDLECQRCGYLNTLEFAFEEGDQVGPQ